MKDAKGHGSEAHSTGVQQIGQPKEYHWVKSGKSHFLMSGGLGTQIATVSPHGPKQQYRAEYNWPHSSGAPPSGWSLHSSPAGAKNYIESRLSKFWEPPNVVGKK